MASCFLYFEEIAAACTILFKIKHDVVPTRREDINKISVYQADLSCIPAQWLAGFYQSLSIEERARECRFFKKEDRVNYVITYGILRLILSHHCQLPPKEIQIHRSDFGKPYVTNKNIHFNLSHAKALLVIAIAHHEVGIDVEYVDAKFEFQQVVKLVLTQAEQRVLAHAPMDKQQEKFFEYWTAKEAVLKLLGTGFRRDPTTLQITDGRVHFSGTDAQAPISLTPLTLMKHHFTGYVACTHRASKTQVVYQVVHDLATPKKVGCISGFAASLGDGTMSA
jgi:phosphopantetheine--protein transferase-like protein